MLVVAGILASAVVLFAAALVLVVRLGVIQADRGSTSLSICLPVRNDGEGYRYIEAELPNLELTFGGWHFYVVCGRWAR